MIQFIFALPVVSSLNIVFGGESMDAVCVIPHAFYSHLIVNFAV